MFKCVITEWFGPFCGEGGYGSETTIGMDKSPKRAVAKAASFWQHRMDGSQICKSENEDAETGICGGGVPIMKSFAMYRNGKKILQRWS